MNRFFALLLSGLIFLPGSYVFGQNEPIRVVVYDFDTSAIPVRNNDTPAQLLRDLLAQKSTFDVLERARMAELWQDRSHAEQLPSAYDSTTAAEVGRMLEANMAVFGHISVVGSDTLISARLVEVETSIIKEAATVHWNQKRPLEALNELVNTLLSTKRDPVDTSGHLRIEVEPSESQILLADTSFSSAPVSLAREPGRHKVRIVPRSKRYRDTTVTIRVPPQDTARRSIRLAQSHGRLSVRHRTRRSAFYLDGEFIGIVQDTVLSVPAGSHTTWSVFQSGETYKDTVQVRPKRESKVIPGPSNRGSGAHTRSVYPDERLRYILAASRSNIHVVDSQGRLGAINVLSGKDHWWNFDGAKFPQPIRVGSAILMLDKKVRDLRGGEVVYHRVIEVTSSNGRTRWRSEWIQSEWAISSRSGDNGFILFSNGRGLLRTDDKSGRSWFRLNNPDDYRNKKIQFTQSRVFISTENGEKLRVNRLSDGSYSWSRGFESGITDFHRYHGNVLVATRQSLHLVDVTSGVTVWRTTHQLGELRVLYHDEKRTYLRNGDGQLYAISQRPKNQQHNSLFEQVGWQKQVGNVVHSILSVDDRDILTGVSGEECVFSVDLLNEQLLYKKCLSQEVEDAQVTDGLILVLDDEGNVEVFAHPSRPAAKLRGVLKGSGPSARMEPFDSTKHPQDTLFSYSPSFWIQNAVDSIPTPTSVVAEVTNGPHHRISATNKSKLRRGQLIATGQVTRVAANYTRAHFWIDGRYVGQTPIVERGVQPGRHSIRLFHSNAQVVDTSIAISKKPYSYYNLKLRPRQENVVQIQSYPSSAEVYFDESRIGKTPYSYYGADTQRNIIAEIRKPGYTVVKDTIDVDNSITKRKYDLKLAHHKMSIFFGGVVARGNFPVGWANSEISSEGPDGQPVIRSPFRINYHGQLSVSPTIPVSRNLRIGVFGIVNPSMRSVSPGFVLGTRAILFERFRLSVGYGVFSPWTQSKAPTTGFGRNNEDAPLEEWSHPIDSVFVSNSSPHYAIAEIGYRVTPRLQVNARGGLAVRLPRLQGTALEPSNSAHLVKNEARSYTLVSESGFFGDVKIQYVGPNVGEHTYLTYGIHASHYFTKWSDIIQSKNAALGIYLGITRMR